MGLEVAAVIFFLHKQDFLFCKGLSTLRISSPQSLLAAGGRGEHFRVAVAFVRTPLSLYMQLMSIELISSWRGDSRPCSPSVIQHLSHKSWIQFTTKTSLILKLTPSSHAWCRPQLCSMPPNPPGPGRSVSQEFWLSGDQLATSPVRSE